MRPSVRRLSSVILRSWLGTIVITVVIALSFKSAIADWNVIPSGSMRPTLIEGDRIFVNKLAYDLKIPFSTLHIYKWKKPNRGDIVVFYSPADRTRLVKRIIGIPGDTIEMKHENLIINGITAEYEVVKQKMGEIVLREEYGVIQHNIKIMESALAPRSFGPVTVPEGKYLMLGDNRNNSADSRYFGMVDRELIVGKATRIVMSLDYDNHYLPRKSRYLKKI